MLDMQTLELIMPDGEENRIHQIDVADPTNFYLQEENGEESLYECHVNSETFYMIDSSTGTYFEGTYSVSENTITVSVTDYDYGVQPVDIAWQEKTYTITDEDGYVIQTDLKISPWIKQDNTELLDGAWNEIEMCIRDSCNSEGNPLQRIIGVSIIREFERKPCLHQHVAYMLFLGVRQIFNADRYQTRKIFTGGDAPQDSLVKISFVHCIDLFNTYFGISHACFH